MTSDADFRFREWFERGTGHLPYAYQQALTASERPPSVLQVPTGSGKTQAVIGAWLYQRKKGVGPRRLVYALPMRSLVEQTSQVAHTMVEQLEATDDVGIQVLMGGEGRPADDWRLRPEGDQILIGTIDMLLSRALNRGYAESRYAWPIAFGLLNSDCRWVFDEVQLMGPARATSAQLDGLRATLGTALPCETMWVSATVDRPALQTVDRPDLGDVLSLPDEDREGSLATRLLATKLGKRIDLTDEPPARTPARVAELAAERHLPGTRTLVVLNTVQEAQQTYRELGRHLPTGGPHSVLLHSRFRPGDRARHMQAALAEPPPAGTIVVSTQVIEAGVDLSSRTLITALAPFSSIVQRLGRCNRAGEYAEATVLWLDPGQVDDSAKGRKAAAPYAPFDLNCARAQLAQLDGVSLSPIFLESVEVREIRDTPAILRRRDLLDLFDTAADLSGTDIDIAPFIRPDDERSVAVFFRALDGPTPGRDQPVPAPEELVQVPSADVIKRRRWVPDYVDGSWRPEAGGRPPPPGSTVMLDAAEGGYDPEIGWSTTHAKGPVAPIEPRVKTRVEGQATDRLGAAPEELSAHLRAVAEAAEGIVESLGLHEWGDELRVAAALHDIGKAHDTFQTLMRQAIGDTATANGDERLWAKSGTSGGRYNRRHFRHELASALVLTAIAGDVGIPNLSLTRYLIGAHHGRARVAIRPAPGEEPPDGALDNSRFALGIVDGDRLPPVDTPLGKTPAAVLNLAPMELGAEDSWTDHALWLRDHPQLGPFRLGLLEAVLRMADWRASGA